MRLTITVCLFILATTSHLRATDWPQWRGPNRDGVSGESGWIAQWPAGGAPVAWKVNVGAGFSTVSIVGDRLFTMGFRAEFDSAGAPRQTADGKVIGSEVIQCLDAASGALIWQHADPISDERNNWGPATFSTPTVNDGHVYTVGKQGRLCCLDARDGRVVWNKELIRDFGAVEPFYGFACSPLVVGNRVIVECGGGKALYLALDRETGELAWTWGKGAKPGFSSPVVYDAVGGRGIVVVTPSLLVGLRAKSGEELWRYEGHRKSGMNTCATPIVRGDEIFLTGAWDGRLAVLLRITPTGPKVIWENPNFLNFVHSAVLVDGYLFGIHSTGHLASTCSLRCVRFETGEVMWDEPGFGHASLMAADGKLILLSDHCELVIADASPSGFKPLTRAQVLGGESSSCPILCNGRLYCRNKAGDLVCFDVKTGKK